jgi:hypothetical protein
MHTAILIVEQPDREQATPYNNWEMAIGKLVTISERHQQIQIPTVGCAIVELTEGPQPLQAALDAAQHCRYRILFFEKAPQWVQTPNP